LNVPNDPTLLNIVVTLSEIYNDDLILFANCGALAGSCPCWDFVELCFAADIECTLSLSACSCPENLWYFTVYNENVDEDSNDFFPGSFTLQAYFEYYPIGEIIPIEVSRSVVRFSGSLSSKYDGFFPDSFDSDYYWISTTNIDPKHDALVLTLTALVAVPAETQDFGVLTLVVAKGGIASSISPQLTSCYPQTRCFVDVNSWPEETEKLASCKLVFYPCYDSSSCTNDDCSIEELFDGLPWDYTEEFYVTVALDSELELVDYTLEAQVIHQAPLGLTNGEPFYGYVANSQYVHFQFTLPTSRSVNSILNAQLYANYDQITSARFFIHYDDNSQNPTLAGDSDHCYEHDFCSACHILGIEASYCIYEIHPCELSTQSGTYYFSVYGEEFQGAGQQKTDFTLTVSIWEPVELLEGTIGIEHPSKIYDYQTLYYSVTVPSLVTGSIVGRVLNIDLTGVHFGNLFFKISNLVEPFEDCGCFGGRLLEVDELNEWRRYPCELSAGDIYYISVSGSQDESCDPVEFLIHARVYDVTEETISLTSVDSVVVGSIDRSGFLIGYNEWHAFRFTTNAVEGSILEIDITQPFPTGETDPKAIEARLSIGDIATRSGYNGRDNVGADPNTDRCVDSWVCEPNDLITGQTCHFYVDPCEVPEGSTNWYLTFTGEDLLVEKHHIQLIFQLD